MYKICIILWYIMSAATKHKEHKSHNNSTDEQRLELTFQVNPQFETKRKLFRHFNIYHNTTVSIQSIWLMQST
jgi:hypothetical protein